MRKSVVASPALSAREGTRCEHLGLESRQRRRTEAHKIGGGHSAYQGRSGLECVECVGCVRSFLHSSGDTVQCREIPRKERQSRGRRPSRFSFPGPTSSSSQVDADQRCARTLAHTHTSPLCPFPACSRSPTPPTPSALSITFPKQQPSSLFHFDNVTSHAAAPTSWLRDLSLVAEPPPPPSSLPLPLPLQPDHHSAKQVAAAVIVTDNLRLHRAAHSCPSS